MPRKNMGIATLLNPHTPRESRAIFEDLSAYSTYPRPNTDGWIRELFNRASGHVPSYVSRSLNSHLLMLECFLQITGLTLCGVAWAENKKLWELFLGALQSHAFLAALPDRRYVLTRSLLWLLAESDWKPDEIWLKRVHPSTTHTKGTLERFRRRFECLYTKKRIVEYWLNWPGTNLDGRRTWFDLVQMYQRFGQKYTRQFHIACAQYFALGRVDYIPLKHELPEFMVNNYQLTLRARTDSAASGEFFSRLVVHCLENKAPNERVETLIAKLRTQVPLLVKSLIASGMFAEPDGGFPKPPPRYVIESETHVKTVNGTSTRTKCITPFSTLSFTDEEALTQKAKQVAFDLETVHEWAKKSSQKIWSRYLARTSSWQLGTPRRRRQGEIIEWAWGDVEATSDFADAAATLKYHGFLTQRDCEKKDGWCGLNALYRRQLEKRAYELALPTCGALVPFMTLLVIENTEITSSYLETLELYDKYGSRVGFGRTQGGYFLRGYKRRRGKALAEQTLMLSFESARTVLQLICLTAVCRRYLKKKGNDTARYLLLSTGRAFGYPIRIKSIAASTTSQPAQVASFVSELESLTSCSREHAQYIASNFSLPALRAQMVTKIYLETHNTAEVARALGQVCFNFRLVSRYIPMPIMRFFMDRWVRIHQTRIVVEALIGSPYKLEVSHLGDEGELERFVKNHCTELDSKGNLFSNQTPKRRQDMEGATTLIGIDAAIMTIFCSISLALASKRGKIREGVVFWADLADPLISEIEFLREARPDLAEYLDQGRKAGSAALVEGMLYE